MTIAIYIQRTLWTFFYVAISISSSTQNKIVTGNTLSSVTDVVTRVSAVLGGEADLPCDSRPPLLNDRLVLVVWYRDDNPVYSYDSRVPGPTGHWSDDTFGERARWVGLPRSALHIQDIQSRDRATYRCRVDFQVSPTRNYRIALDVIELPSKPMIFDEYGKEISGVAGPYNEGDDFKLICFVHGGNPTPRVQWLEGDTVLTTLGVGEHQPGSSRSLTLVVTNATRAHLSSVYTCTADNTLLSPPQRASVRLDLNLPPLTVDIISREPLSAGRAAEIWCKVTGARPYANITWWLNGKRLDSITKPQDANNNETLSLLQMTPSKKHNKKELICRAEHTNFTGSTIESVLQLDVYYVPKATIRLGKEMNPNNIEEGDDVYFECKVDANPPAYKVVWEHNGVLLRQSVDAGVIFVGNKNLVIQNLLSHHAGLYICTASNVEGDGKSLPTRMQVMYRPVCKQNEVKSIGAVLQEPLKVECEVDAFPPPDTFAWTFNNSAGSITVDSDHFTIETKEGKSVLTYTPMSQADYGTLTCWATNLSGRQKSPCVYTLLPPTRPEPPSNCSVNNLTQKSFDLTCFAGYNGGLHTTYIAEVWENDKLVRNSTNNTAVWNLRTWDVENQVKMIVYATNSKGASEHVTYTVETVLRLSPRTEAQASWTAGSLLVVIFTIVTISTLALITKKIKRKFEDYEANVASKNQKTKICLPEERNPDLIPLNKGKNIEPQYTTITKPEMKNSTSAHSLFHSHSSSTVIIQDSELQNKQNAATGAMTSQLEAITTKTPLIAHQESHV